MIKHTLRCVLRGLTVWKRKTLIAHPLWVSHYCSIVVVLLSLFSSSSVGQPKPWHCRASSPFAEWKADTLFVALPPTNFKSYYNDANERRDPNSLLFFRCCHRASLSQFRGFTNYCSIFIKSKRSNTWTWTPWIKGQKDLNLANWLHVMFFFFHTEVTPTGREKK